MFTIYEVKCKNEEKGYHFFSPDSMRFFDSRVSSYVVPGYHNGEYGAYFITSEKFDYNSPRLYTVRFIYDESGSIDTVGEFREFSSIKTAKTAIKHYRKLG